MTNKTFKRFALILTIVLATMLLVVSGTQKSAIEHVSAEIQTEPFGPYSRFTGEIQYEYDLTLEYLRNRFLEENNHFWYWDHTDCPFHVANDYKGTIDASAVFYSSDGHWDWLDDDDVLIPGTYTAHIYWGADGSYDSGDKWVEFKVTPCVKETSLDEMSVYGTFSEYDNWTIVMNTEIMGDDDVKVVWYYNGANDEKTKLSESTPVGTYAIWPELEGEDADRYELNIQQYNGETYVPCNESSPMDFTVQVKTVQVVLEYYEKALTMYNDGASAVNNTLYYNAGALPFTVVSKYSLAVDVEFGYKFWLNSESDKIDNIEEIGTYSITTKSFYVVDEEMAKNISIVNSNCSVTIEKRGIYVDIASYYPCEVHYTSEEVKPERGVNYEITYDTAFGEQQSDVVEPELNDDGSVYLVNVSYYADYYLNVVDTAHYQIQDNWYYLGWSDSVKWEYGVVPGIPTINFEQVEDYYYRQEITNISEKLSISITTTDPNQDEIGYELYWSNNGGATWNLIDVDNSTGYPESSDVETIGSTLVFKVETKSTTNFASTSAQYTFTIQKAPVYLRAAKDLVYNGEWQEPELTDYLFYIYKPGVTANLWYNVFGCASDDYTTILNYYERDGEWIAHTMTFENQDAGVYELRAALIQDEGGYMHLQDPNFENYYEMIRDEDSVFKILKKELTYSPYAKAVEPVTYDPWEKEFSATYGDHVYPAPYATGISGFVGSDEDYDHPEEHWYYTTKDGYEYTETDSSLSDIMTTPGEYKIKYLAIYENYKDIQLEYAFRVNQKELTIKWYTSEDAYKNGETGIISGNSILSQLTLTYNGVSQVPYYVIEGVVEGDETPTVDTAITEGAPYYSPLTEAVRVGEYRYKLINLSDNHYVFPDKYDDCMIAYTIQKATVTIIPDADQSKFYGEADPKFTYTVTGEFGDDKVSLTGALARKEGEIVDYYEYELGTLALTDTTINQNYKIALGYGNKFSINKKQITAIFSKTEKTYNGENLDPTFDYFDGIVGNDKLTIDFTGTPTKLVGTYTKTFVLVATETSKNYELASSQVEFKIVPAIVGYNVKINGETRKSVQYNGSEFTLTVELTGLIDGDKVNVSYSGTTSATNVGKYTATLNLTGDADVIKNYQFDEGKDKVEWSITQEGLDMTKFESAYQDTEVTYNGSKQNIKNVSTIPSGYYAEFYYDNEKITGIKNAGIYEIEIRFGRNDNNLPEADSIIRVLTINPKSIEIEWGENTFEYDGTAHRPEYELLNVIGNDDVDIVWSTEAVTDASTTTARVKTELTGVDAGNYALTGSKSCNLIINKRTITITVGKGISSVYGSEQAELKHTVSNNIIASDLADGKKVYELTCEVEPTTNVGTYDIDYEIINENYNVVITNNKKAYSVTKKDLHVTIEEAQIYYGDVAPKFKVLFTESDFVNGENESSLNGSAYGDTDYAQYNEVGTYSVAVKGISSANYNIIPTNGKLNVVARPVTAHFINTSKVYNGENQKPDFDHFENIIAGDDLGISFISGSTVNCGSWTGAWALDFALTGAKKSNYVLTKDNVDFEITKKALTVTADSYTITYGDAVPTYDFTVEGLVGEDTKAVVTTEYNCEYAQFKGVGEYVITLVNYTSANYEITPVTGKVTVNKKALTVTAEDKQVTYGDAIPTFTVAYDGWVNGENETTENVFVGELVYACDYTNTSVVGTYTITPRGLTSANYAITFNDGTLEVQKKAITISYNNDHKVVTYGDATVWNNLGEEMQANNFYLVTNEGWVGNDTVENSLNCSMNTKADGTGDDVSENLDPTLAVGTYYLVVTGRNTANYDFTIDLGDEAYLNVTKKSLTITAENKNITYGDAIPAYTVEYKGFVNDETPEVLGGELAYACEYAQFKAIGNYTITPSGLTSGNYEITFVDGTVTVAKKAIIITIDNKDSVYGDAVKTTTATVPENAIVNNDDVYNLSCEVTVRSHVGSYVISGTSTNDNYEVQFVNGTYRVTPRELELIWSDLQFVYDQLAHKPSVTAENKANGDIVLLAVSGEQVVAGSHTATASIVDNNDYVLPENHSCPFTITKPTTFTYNKPLTTEQVANEGVDLTEVFNNMDTTASNTTFTLKVGESLVTFNKTAITQIAGKENVVMKFELLDGEKATEINKNAVAVLEVSLSGIPFDEGSITITCPFENKAPGGKEARLYFIDENGKKTKVDATFTGETVEFTPPHFSTYAVMYKLTALSIVLIILGILIVVGGGLAAVYFFVIKKAPVVETADADTNQILEDAEASNSEAEDNAETEDDTEESEDTEDTDTDQE